MYVYIDFASSSWVLIVLMPHVLVIYPRLKQPGTEHTEKDSLSKPVCASLFTSEYKFFEGHWVWRALFDSCRGWFIYKLCFPTSQSHYLGEQALKPTPYPTLPSHYWDTLNNLKWGKAKINPRNVTRYLKGDPTDDRSSSSIDFQLILSWPHTINVTAVERFCAGAPMQRHYYYPCRSATLEYSVTWSLVS